LVSGIGPSFGAHLRLQALHQHSAQPVDRFQRILRALGVDVALREAGVKEGDMVRIGAGELEWTE